MSTLPESAKAWRTGEFDRIFKHELGSLGIRGLPLQQGLSRTSTALDHDLGVVILAASEVDAGLEVRAGIFYSGIDAGCSCADDPTPVEELPEYCEVLVRLDLETARAVVILLREQV